MTNDGDLRQDFGELKGKFTSLEDAVEKLTGNVEELTAVLNQARGAKYVIFTIPAIVGAIVSVLAFFGLRATIGH